MLASLFAFQPLCSTAAQPPHCPEKSTLNCQVLEKSHWISRCQSFSKYSTQCTDDAPQAMGFHRCSHTELHL
ncbi:hypothetical protein QBC45DRAFT_412018 [Copromyces sp. CBS 386.78]|nr:hypothetical protein QBC45DRAFT_412018 [Copromyces sp. CBS 386.78]